MNCAKPIIATKTGGLTRQVVDHRDGSENGVALEVRCKSLVGSQGVPYIYEDYIDVNEAAEAIYKLYSMPRKEREELGQKARRYALSEFGYQKTIDEWDRTMEETIRNFKEKTAKRWTLEEVGS
jgi:glycosyltransferase involved in cell wall biosynthesis